MLWHGQAQIDRWWRYHLHDAFWRIYAFADTGAELISGTTRFACPPQRIIVVPPWSELRSQCQSRVGHAWIHVQVHGESAVERHISQPAVMSATQVPNPLFAAVASWRGDEAPWTIGSDLATQQAISGIIAAARVSVPNSSAIDARVAAARSALAPAFELLSHRLLHVDPPALAAACGLTRSHFSRRFALATGTSPARYLLQRRIRQAGDLLLESGATIDDVADRCGFSDRFHFSRAFARIMGVPPGEYQRRSAGMPAVER